MTQPLFAVLCDGKIKYYTDTPELIPSSAALKAMRAAGYELRLRGKKWNGKKEVERM